MSEPISIESRRVHVMPVKSEDISYEDWMNSENGWSLYRSFSSRERAMWYLRRLPDEDGRSYRYVNHPARHIIVTRESFAHRN